METRSNCETRTLEGTLIHVVYANDQNHWSVARFKVSGSGENLTIVGVLPGLRPGEVLRITGRDRVHPRFGPQFEVEAFQSVTPTTVEGIRRYLASGMLSGLGKVLAERIVDRFGAETLKVIDEDPEALLRVEGIGRKKLARWLETWGEGKAARETLVFLRGHGFGAALATKVHEHYGSRAIQVARDYPYRLAREVHGVGFIMADRIARSVGLPEEDPERLEAGLFHVLREQVKDGQVAVPGKRLVERGAALLSVDPLLVEAALDGLVHDAHLRSESFGEEGDRLVYLPYLHEAEIQVAEALRGLLGQRPVLGDRVVAMLEANRDQGAFHLTDMQMEAVRLALTHSIAVITGGPGVGKTTIVRAIVTMCRRMGLEVQLAAPTGRAAKRLTEATGLGARTLHRLLEYDPVAGTFNRGPQNPVEADLVLIDETSMVDLVLARDLLWALPRECSLVLIGDADQLPSVGPGRVLGDVLLSNVFPSIRLGQVFRQQEGGLIIRNAHRINQGQMPESDNVEGADFFLVYREDPAAVQAYVEDLVTRRIPRGFGLDPLGDIQVLTPMYRGEVGADNLNERLQSLLNPGEAVLKRGKLALRPGDRVMQLTNDYQKGVFNGDVGKVVRVEDEDRVRVKIDGKEVEYQGQDLENLTLAYAVTVHKAQGSEYPAVVLPLTTTHWPLLQRNLLYTAVTRGKKLVVLVGSRRAIGRAVRNDRIRERHGLLKERLRADPVFPESPGGESREDA